MNNSETRSSKSRWSEVGGVVICAVVLVITPFIPLVLSLFEEAIFHSRHVEQFCETIGIHGALSRLYETIFQLFR